MIRLGKGKKDRMIPIGSRALAWIDKYVIEVRPTLVREPDDGTLFLSNLNEAFTPNRLTQLVREYVDAAQLGKRGACHLFRHTMATLMLENGADIRFIQQMLGHAELEHHADLHAGQHPQVEGNPLADASGPTGKAGRWRSARAERRAAEPTAFGLRRQWRQTPPTDRAAVHQRPGPRAVAFHFSRRSRRRRRVTSGPSSDNLRAA